MGRNRDSGNVKRKAWGAKGKQDQGGEKGRQGPDAGSRGCGPKGGGGAQGQGSDGPGDSAAGHLASGVANQSQGGRSRDGRKEPESPGRVRAQG